MSSADPPKTASGPASPLSERARRISYFMLVRLMMLAGLTVVAGVLSYSQADALTTSHAAVLWGTVGMGFALTVGFARRLPRTRSLGRFAAVQTGADLLLATVTVHISGGVDSGFVTLYPIAVLGAAVMGGQRQTWVSAGFATLLCLGAAALEGTGLLTPMSLSPYVPLSSRELGMRVTRTVGAIAGVTVLSSYLNSLLSRSVSQLDKLRILNENIVRSISSGLLTVDMHEAVLDFNPMARSILDLEDEDIGRPLQSILPGYRLSATGLDGRQELVVHTRRGRSVRVGLSLARLTDSDGRRLGHVVNFQDLTKLHELSQRVRRNDRLAAVGGLAASVAHEIRNPLAAISGSAELLATADLTGDDARLLRIIRRESGRLSRLVTDMLSFTRPRPPQVRRTNLRLSVQEASEAFRAAKTSANIEILHLDTCTTAPLVDLDPAQLSAVLWNLLRNAAEAMEFRGTITISVAEYDDGLAIEVADTGPGISAEHLDRIFDPFFTTKDSGTGFGLAIVHRMVEDNGGSIACHSSTSGTTFTLYFSRADAERDDPGVLELAQPRR